MSLLFALLALFLALVIHELGHYTTSKLFKLPVNDFIIGTGPTFFHFKAFGTSFTFKLFPIAGCVIHNIDELNKISLFKEWLMIISGVLFNLLTACLTLSIIFHTNLTTVLQLILYKLPASFIASFTQTPLYSADYGLENTLAQLASSTHEHGFLLTFVAFNLMLFFFNLIPLPILDGGQLILAPIRRWASRSAKYGQLIDKITSFLAMACVFFLVSPLIINELLEYMTLAQSFIFTFIILLVLILINEIRFRNPTPRLTLKQARARTANGKSPKS